MKKTTTTALLGALCLGLSGTLLAAEPASQAATDSGANNFYSLILGLLAVIFAGMALCYGLVKLVEKGVQRLNGRRPAAVSVRPLPRAA